MGNNLVKLPERTFTHTHLKLDLYIARRLLIMALWREVKEKKKPVYQPLIRAKYNGYRDYWQMENEG